MEIKIEDFILTGIISIMNFALNLLPKEISFFTLSEFSNLLTSISNFWTRSFSLSSRFFPFGWFFTFLIVITFMEMSLLSFKAFKYVINILRGAGG